MTEERVYIGKMKNRKKRRNQRRVEGREANREGTTPPPCKGDATGARRRGHRGTKGGAGGRDGGWKTNTAEAEEDEVAEEEEEREWRGRCNGTRRKIRRMKRLEVE